MTLHEVMSDKFKDENPLDLTCGVSRKFQPAPDSPTWPFVLAFAYRMEYKLHLNRHKGDRDGWLKDSAHELSMRVHDEAKELTEAIIGNKTPNEIANEAADVANFAMMVADVAINTP